MSPEQATGRPVDYRSDQFALGAILYEMASGRRAFARPTAVETLSAILKDEPPPLAAVNPGAPEPLEWIVRRCLAKEPEDRYHSTRDLARDLAGLRDRRSGPAAAAPAPPARRAKTGRYLAVGLVLAGLVAVGAFAVLGRWNAPGGVHSLAVLPLQPISASAEDAALGLGIADTIIRGFSRTGALTVRPLSAVQKYAKSNVDALAAARELRADAVLEGSLQRSGEKLRVSVNLLRAGDGRSMWTESFDVPASEVFAVEDAVSDAVVARLRLHLDPSQRDRLKKRFTENPEAYDAFARGLAEGDQSGPGTGGEHNVRAIAAFERAVALDPGYALAHARLADSYLWRDFFFEPGAGYLEKAKREMAEAERLDPQLADAHVARYQLAWSHYQGFDLETAMRELRTARRLDPSVSRGDAPDPLRAHGAGGCVPAGDRARPRAGSLERPGPHVRCRRPRPARRGRRSPGAREALRQAQFGGSSDHEPPLPRALRRGARCGGCRAGPIAGPSQRGGRPRARGGGVRGARAR